ncbi:MAG: dihydroorotate dehydrogenase electron transfer subunit [Clostridiales bacterium]|nr:dihydroorotate dehydrogenase electron transfer subunit [Clostridiales bacterium]
MIITSVKKLTETAFELSFRAPEMALKAHAGQFVHIKCGNENFLRRPISICDVRGDDIVIVFEIRGKGTDWLSRRTVGEELDMLGPLGRGFDTCREGRILLAGGGIGLPPMLYTSKLLKSCDAVLGFRSKSLVMLEEEFREICENVIVSTDDGSYGYAGYAVNAARELIKTNSYIAIYACGPKIMLKSFVELAEELNIDCFISLEERMGCGFGACLVCSCKTKQADGFTYSRVCADGPVFNAKEVIFDD